MYLCRIYSGDITTGKSHSINYSAAPMRPVCLNSKFLQKRKVFRGLHKFRESVLISWCQIAKHKKPQKTAEIARQLRWHRSLYFCPVFNPAMDKTFNAINK